MLIYFSDEVLQTCPRYFFVTVFDWLSQIGVENLHTHAEIGLIEVVADIPTDLVVLATLLNDSMEEGEHEDERREGLMWTLTDWARAEFVKRVLQVEFKTVRRLGDHFERALQNADRELACWLGGQPKPEVRMRFG